jgi:hypothetical protein
MGSKSSKRVSKVIQVKFMAQKETIELFEKRKQEVEILLTDMFLRLKKHGRPAKDNHQEVKYAA